MQLGQEQLDYVRENFYALTDALLPSVDVKGEQVPAVVSDYTDLDVHSYLIDALDNYVSVQMQLNQKTLVLSYPTALMLDIAATELLRSNRITDSFYPTFEVERTFAYISKTNRLKTLTALENLEIDLFLLPNPFKNDGGLVKHVVDALNRFALFGFYSEWSAYGSTRFLPPQARQLEFFPWSWKQVGYPGVAYGYRDFRGFLLKMGRNEGAL